MLFTTGALSDEATVAVSTSPSQSVAASQTAMPHTDDMTTASYSCPMHPDETSNQPGRCSICGMFLVKQSQAETPESEMDKPSAGQTGHAHHEHAHEAEHYSCPMHPDETSDQPGRCSICGMFLVKEGGPEGSMTETVEAKPTMELPHDHSQHGHQHQAPLYVCPMHPQIVRDDPDASCPICGMDLVAKAVESAPIQPSSGQAETYICPMHPQIVSHEPGSCPICGMDLVTRETASATEGQPQVFLTGAVIQNMGVRTTKVTKGTLSKKIRTQGRVTYDDDRIIQVHPRTAGWIENLYIRTDGVRVERKDDLADYFSPDVLWAQQDYISALEDSEVDSFSESDTPDPARVFRERSSFDLLKYFKVPTMDIMGLERSMEPRSIIPIKAPQGGVLIEHNVREGTFVTPANNIFTIADLSEVWIMVDIFEHQLAWIRPDIPAEISTPAYPGRTWQGKVDFIYPEVDPKTRTIRARIEVKNPEELLMPNMFVQINLTAHAHKPEALIIPREAVILTGEREVVVKALGKGHFQPVEITSGLWNNRHAEILSGLAEGDEIVVSGQFLIDSESSLQASFLRMMEE
ncbi:MAG: efflux RND transporter periplasmic adaptor subunit [Gammaproteobacteria bacterium]|nr:efflux RND transporter periplasmic adaptor subunit [Gammaproteobacteria bacterium]